MRVRTVYDLLDEISPFELQEEWDNSGLIVGSFDLEVDKIYISLDIDDWVIENVEPNSLLITHHPLIFKGIKRVNGDTFSTKYLIKLIQKNISLISMHTNFDKTHLNEYFARNILGLEGEVCGFVFYSDVYMGFDELCSLVKERMNLNFLRVVRANDFVKRVAVTTGAGMGLLEGIKAECFLTGDIKYHEAVEAKARGISLIDITHYESEKYFVDVLYKVLKGMDVEIVKLNSKNPFTDLI